jgi:hypothetical protein
MDVEDLYSALVECVAENDWFLTDHADELLMQAALSCIAQSEIEEDTSDIL